MIRDAIAIAVEGQDLTAELACGAMQDIMSGEASPAQIAAFLTALRTKGETALELAGCARAMRAAVTPVRSQRSGLVDTCGTGGDGLGTFNISTAVAFVAAGMGLAVAKHGNRGVSSKCGSADVLEALGVRIDLGPEDVARCIDEAGIGFIFAPAYHPGTRHAMPVRRELGFRTLFNLIGPLCNPAGVQRQVVGTYSLQAAENLARAFALLETEHVLVVHGSDGLDEISPCAPTAVWEVRGLSVSGLTLEPASFGIQPIAHSSLTGGDAQHNAYLIEQILLGEAGPRADAVVINAAAVAYVGGAAPSVLEGVQIARQSISSGAAMEALQGLREVSNQPAHELSPELAR